MRSGWTFNVLHVELPRDSCRLCVLDVHSVLQKHTAGAYVDCAAHLMQNHYAQICLNSQNVKSLRESHALNRSGCFATKRSR